MASTALCLAAAAPASAAQTGTDWLWLTASETACTWTVTVNWAGFQEAKLLEVFVTETYTGVPLAVTDVRIKNKQGVATVTVGPLATSATAVIFYPWAQLIDTHGNAIPASLDFSGGNLAYCAAP
jgi:hypothetical protein